MKYLLDTHLLLWVAAESAHLPNDAKKIILDPGSTLFYSPASLWEIVIKNSLGRDDFSVNPLILRRALNDNGYQELPIRSEQVVMISQLPMIHRDPFDRMLIAQAITEGLLLLTSDVMVAKYTGPIQLVK